MSTGHSVLSVETSGEVTVARLRWPGIREAAGLWVASQLDDFFERQRAHPSKVVVLVAPPEAVDAANLELCAADEHEVGESELVQRMLRRENAVRRLVTDIRMASSFVVAVVHGEVALRMAAPLLACDYRIASDATTFRFTSRQHPVAPAGGVLWFLNRLVGEATTVDLVVNGSVLDAAGARRLGLVNLVIRAEQLEAEALAAARRLAEQPRQTLLQLKRATIAAGEALDAYFDREIALLARAAPTLLPGHGGS